MHKINVKYFRFVVGDQSFGFLSIKFGLKINVFLIKAENDELETLKIPSFI